jgi:hypothetical protein
MQPFFPVLTVLLHPFKNRAIPNPNFPRYQVAGHTFFQVQLHRTAFDFVTFWQRIFPTAGNDGKCAILARRAAPSSPPRRAHPFHRSLSLTTCLAILLTCFHQ